MSDTGSQETKSPELLKAELDKAIADARKATADAAKAESDLMTSRITSLVPDLSKIDNGAVTTSDTQGTRATLLGHHALDTAAAKVIAAVEGELTRNHAASDAQPVNVLITDKADLAGLDGVYQEVLDGLTRLIGVADDLEVKLAGAAASGGGGRAGIAALPLIPIGIALASVIPGVAAMLGSSKSLKSFAITPDTTAAVSSVAGKLIAASIAVLIDDFRLVPAGHVRAMEGALRDRRTRLAERRLETEQRRVEQDQLRASSQASIDSQTKALEATDLKPADRATRENALRQAEIERDALASAAQHFAVLVGLLDGLATSIDTFLTSIHTSAAGGRSPFVVASLFEQLHAQPLAPETVPNSNTSFVDPRTTHVLYLKALSGSLDQMVDDRKFGADKIDETASIELSYWLLETHTGRLVASGVAIGTARRHGEVDANNLPITTS